MVTAKQLANDCKPKDGDANYKRKGFHVSIVDGPELHP